MNRPKCDASRDTFATPAQRRKLVDGALEFADLGADRTRFLEVARSLSFLMDSGLHKNDDPANQQSTSLRGRPFSIVRRPNNVVETNMSSAVLHEIKQRAEKENVPLGRAITTWVKRAINPEGIGLR